MALMLLLGAGLLLAASGVPGLLLPWRSAWGPRLATLATLLGAGFTLREALPLANRAGGIVVGKFGTASVSFEELFG